MILVCVCIYIFCIDFLISTIKKDVLKSISYSGFDMFLGYEYGDMILQIHLKKLNIPEFDIHIREAIGVANSCGQPKDSEPYCDFKS